MNVIFPYGADSAPRILYMRGLDHVDINKKLEQVSRLFRIEGTYVGSEMIQVGNVNKTYEVKFILPDGTPQVRFIGDRHHVPEELQFSYGNPENEPENRP